MGTQVKKVTAHSYYRLRELWPSAVCIKRDDRGGWVGYVFSK